MSEHFIAHGRPSQIMSAFCALNRVQLEDLAGPSKTQAITRLRHELMYLMRQLTVLSQSDIGRHLGGRDMATVHEGIAKVADRMAADRDYRDHMRDMRDQVVRATMFAEADPAKKASVRAALSILTSKDLTDAEARQAAAEVLLKDLHPLQEVAHG